MLWKNSLRDLRHFMNGARAVPEHSTTVPNLLRVFQANLDNCQLRSRQKRVAFYADTSFSRFNGRYSIRAELFASSGFILKR